MNAQPYGPAYIKRAEEWIKLCICVQLLCLDSKESSGLSVVLKDPFCLSPNPMFHTSRKHNHAHACLIISCALQTISGPARINLLILWFSQVAWAQASGKRDLKMYRNKPWNALKSKNSILSDAQQFLEDRCQMVSLWSSFLCRQTLPAL